ncbi:MAG: hypothetical protein ACR2O3_14800 [Rhizobiaceae bacterium]
MTSAKQIAANQENAKRSTGPKTKAGKIRSRKNALRHGLASVILEGSPEDQEVNNIARAILGPSNTDSAATYFAREAAEAENTLRHVREVKVELFNTLKFKDEIALAVSDQFADPKTLPSNFNELLEQSINLDRYERRARSRRKKALRQLMEMLN